MKDQISQLKKWETKIRVFKSRRNISIKKIKKKLQT